MEEHEFEKVFWSLQPELLRFASFHAEGDVADDVVSETFATLWRKQTVFPKTPDEEEECRALAYLILIGHLRNESRARRRRRALWSRAAQSQVEQSTDPVNDLIEANSLVHRCLGKLTASDQEAILLFNAGFGLAEVAQILGCSESAAAKRRQRARVRLRQLLRGEERED